LPVIIKKKSKTPKVFDVVETKLAPPNIEVGIIDQETGIPAFLLRKNWVQSGGMHAD
jgi:hypothetical protein